MVWGKGATCRPRVEVRRDELLLHERRVVGFLQLLVASTVFVRDLNQLGHARLLPALAAVAQLVLSLCGPARQSLLLRGCLVVNNESKFHSGGGRDAVVAAGRGDGEGVKVQTE